jgi:beta-glucosidase
MPADNVQGWKPEVVAVLKSLRSGIYRWPGGNFVSANDWRGYLFDDVTPLYAFGFGLSYTQFQFGKPRLKKFFIGKNKSTVVRVGVTNTGPRAGDEVVQMYIRDKVSSVTRPVKELKGFQRITLSPGETKTISLDVTPEHLAFYNIDMKYAVEPGVFEIMVGNSSRDQDLQKVTLRVK